MQKVSYHGEVLDLLCQEREEVRRGALSYLIRFAGALAFSAVALAAIGVASIAG
jgi:hypothetical protein